MKPIRCTLLNIFISTSLHVSGNYVPIIRRNNYIYATLIFFHSVWVAVWSAGYFLDQTATHTERKISVSRIDTVASTDGGHIVARNM